MAKFITAAQEHVFEEFTGEQIDAVVAYGADLYREGLFKGAAAVSAGFVVGALITTFAKVVKEVAKERKQSKEVEAQ